MNITRNNSDDLNAVVTVKISKEDYAPQVEKMLWNYRKTAAIPGFRKGAVPASMINKQYGKATLIEVVNKLLQENFNKYLQEENLDLLGNPLPVINEDFDWDANEFIFEFELGFAPEFDIKLEDVDNITHYKIVADDALLDEQVDRIRKQYGNKISKTEVAEGDDISGTFVNEEKEINAQATISTDVFKDKETVKKFIGKKAGDVISLNTKGLFNDDHQLMEYLKVEHDDVHNLDINVDFTIEEVSSTEPAELNQELFDKLFGDGQVSSVEDIKAKIKVDAENQFATQADQRFLNDVTESLLEKTNFDLPATFLKKWMQTAGENPLTAEQAEEEYNRSEKGLRYQLIEGKIVNANKLQLTFEELKQYTAGMIRQQMFQFGQTQPTDSDVDGIVTRVLQNQEEAKKISDQLMSQKMLNVYKQKVKSNTKEVTYADFVKESYGE